MCRRINDTNRGSSLVWQAKLCCVCNPQCSRQLDTSPLLCATQYAAVTVQWRDAIATSPPLGDYHAQPNLIHLHQHPWCKYIPPPGGEGREEEEVVGQERERIAGLNKIFHLCICTKLAFQDICFLSFSPAVMIRSKTDNNQATNNPLQRKPNAKICVLCKIIYMVAQQHTRFIHFLPLSLGGRLNQSS